MSRVEAQANLVANLAVRETLREAPEGWPKGAWASAVFIALAFMRRWHPLKSGVVLALLLAALAGSGYAAFARWGIWIPLTGACLTVAMIYLAQGAVAFFSEQRQRRELKTAFSKYVSPAVVDEMIEHPDRLKLGGERRQLSILFSDLAGFTTIAEQLEPEKVSGIVNRLLGEMTEVILKHSGTVDKFLGDGIMAFWGAPILDERQADRAVKAAVEMQEKMAELRAEIQRETGAEIRMRIGINRGECIVGNMGGYSRFEYTAVGDSVNLASRIEGVNKLYGTEILVSEAVVSAVSNGIHFREVDTVRVKGKNVGITVLTPCEDDELVAMGVEALAEYRAGDFEASEAVWRRILAARPGDPVAKVFLERIALLKFEGLPADWDGIWTLDTK
jgi:adenylate cyclase